MLLYMYRFSVGFMTVIVYVISKQRLFTENSPLCIPYVRYFIYVVHLKDFSSFVCFVCFSVCSVCLLLENSEAILG